MAVHVMLVLMMGMHNLGCADGSGTGLLNHDYRLAEAGVGGGAAAAVRTADDAHRLLMMLLLQLGMVMVVVLAKGNAGRARSVRGMLLVGGGRAGHDVDGRLDGFRGLYKHWRASRRDAAAVRGKQRCCCCRC